MKSSQTNRGTINQHKHRFGDSTKRRRVTGTPTENLSASSLRTELRLIHCLPRHKHAVLQYYSKLVNPMRKRIIKKGIEWEKMPEANLFRPIFFLLRQFPFLGDITKEWKINTPCKNQAIACFAGQLKKKASNSPLSSFRRQIKIPRKVPPVCGFQLSLFSEKYRGSDRA